jgi:hypothetical protein
MLGFSATSSRRDGSTKLIGWYQGRQVAVKVNDLTDKDIIQNMEVAIRKMDFQRGIDASQEYNQVLSELTENWCPRRFFLGQSNLTPPQIHLLKLYLPDLLSHLCPSPPALIIPNRTDRVLQTRTIYALMISVIFSLDTAKVV